MGLIESLHSWDLEKGVSTLNFPLRAVQYTLHCKNKMVKTPQKLRENFAILVLSAVILVMRFD